MPLYRLHSTLRDRDGARPTGLIPASDLLIEAPTVRHAAARVLGKADEVFGDATGEAWLVTEDGARVWSLSLDADEMEGAAA
ncbi:hypothetical protein VQ02_26860 [Methylobacterium variabile]|jgi:hypothetical protein|uniref:Uncharacterized protein n=1 Tax=Methylobacterium variabile TaxID=298794 RepID=A0A0J6S7D1_9HYPH|nr:hypothetical protein [Methylobacterium variabile]KMO31130.1 hypothetical protein VQ02_26860 [Methylobacterium variabile]